MLLKFSPHTVSTELITENALGSFSATKRLRSRASCGVHTTDSVRLSFLVYSPLEICDVTSRSMTSMT